MTPLLAQFLSEARDLLEEAGLALLSLEQDPSDAEAVNRVFRAVHTVKGAAGIFGPPYGPITEVLHAAEDILMALRGQRLAMTHELMDLLLQCVDRVTSWLERIAATEALPEDAASEGGRLTQGLRRLWQPRPPLPSLEPPPPRRAAAALHAVRYTPDAQCFFAGEDPLLLVRQAPGLLSVELRGPEPGWAALVDLDPYRCELRFELISNASREALAEHFQYVASEVELCPLEDRPAAARALAAPADPLEPPGSPDSPGLVEGLRTRKTDGIKTLLKVDQAKVDLLMNLVGELVVAKNSLPYLARRAEQHYGVRGLALELKEQHAVLHRIADALQGAVMQVRMLPLSVVFERFIRLVRDLSRKLDKDVELVTEGEDTEMDKSTVDRLGDPLLHLLRNSIDHGIEPPAARVAAGKRPRGTIHLRAARDGDRLVIEISDDGRGIDVAALKRRAGKKGIMDEARLAALSEQEALRLIFAPGLSTAAVVSDISGRGVGMDVVRRDIEGLGGSVAVRSEPGAGTCMTLTVPLTMSITRILTVRVGGEAFGVPMESVVAAVRVPRAALRQMKQQQLFVWRDRLVPVTWLAALLELPLKDSTAVAVLIVRHQGDEVGLVVDGFQEDIDIILRPMEGILAGYQGYLGTAILGDGRALLVLNLREILTWRYTTLMAASFSVA